MLGLTFLFGGINRMEQYYNTTLGQVFGTMLLLSMTSLIIPTVAKLLTTVNEVSILQISRGISIILLFVYGIFLYFQLVSHAVVFNEPSRKVSKRNLAPKKGEAMKGLAQMGGMAGLSGAPVEPVLSDIDDDEPEQPSLPMVTVIVVLLVCTTLLAFNTSFATDSLSGMMDATGLTQTFVGIVLLPLLSNDVTVIKSAVKDKMDLCVNLTVGKCLQTTLLVIPFVVILGWIIGKPLSLSFDGFEVAALFASVLYINSMIAVGKSN